MRALLLAGGFGTRLGPIGEHMPKAMIVVDGDTVLDHLLRKLKDVRVEPIILTNRKFQRFFEKYENVIIEEATSEEEKLGSVSAINNAIKQLRIAEDLLIACADNYFSSDLGGFVSSYTGEPLVGVYHVDKSSGARLDEMATIRFDGCDDFPPPRESFYINEFREKSKPPLSNYIGIGLYILPASVFPILDEFCRGQKRDAPGFFIEHLLDRGMRVKGYLFKGEWCDISHKSYLRAFSRGRLVKSDERYAVADLSLGNLVLSITILHGGERTTGHSHSVGEVYFFIEGEGEIELDGERRRVGSKDVVPIAPGEFHRVYNTRDKDLIFVSAFERYEGRG